MKLNSRIVMRPLSFFIVPSMTVLVLSSLLVSFWFIKVSIIENKLKVISNNITQEILSDLDHAARILIPLGSSATSLAKVFSSSFTKTELSFPSIQAKVAPTLFQALSTIPYLSQISYIGLDGSFFSFCYEDNQQLSAVYSNSSFPKTRSAISTNYSWYAQPANGDTGTLYGEAVTFPPKNFVQASWFQQALNSSNGWASLGSSWNDVQDLMILNTARVDQRGVLSLGFRVKSFIDIFSSVNLYGGSLYLATKDGNVLMDGITNTPMVLSGVSVSLESLNPNGEVGSVTCQSDDGMPRASILKFWETKYVFYCSPVDIIGVQSVFVTAIPYNGLESQVHSSISVSLGLLIVMIFLVIISIFISVVLAIRAARTEMCLRAALIEQKEATQHAERKSMNKSLALASASHDIRSDLIRISGLIDMARAIVEPESELDVNLRLVEPNIEDLNGILNKILDTSKIEAGKMELEEEEFDLGQLLEDVVDMFYIDGIQKGVDVVLDIDEKSFPKFSHVKGDRGRLKQIISNLLSNAVKFTKEGYVSVRAWAEKPVASENSILASAAQTKPMRYLSCLWFVNKNDQAYKDLEPINPVQLDSNRVEFVFEVNDTGKGIPKEKQKSVFENYVQVKNPDSQHEGTGLGLAIVQTLVGMMGGEILIVDNEVGERGTCFRFTAHLSLSEIDQQSVSVIREDDVESSNCGGTAHVFSDSNQHFGPSIWHQSPKHVVSHVVLLIKSEERRKVSQKLIESLGIKVTVVKHLEQLSASLKKIKEKHSISWYSSSSRSDATLSRNSSTRSKEIPLSAQDGTDQAPVSVPKKTNHRGTPNFILLIIDANGGPFRELSRAVAQFRREFANTCTKVVWLDRPGARTLHDQGLDEYKLPASDVIMTKPFHGSHLKGVIGFLPQFRNQAGKDEAGPSGTKATPMRPEFIHSIPEPNLPTTKQEGGEQSNETRPLSGKKTLVAEDHWMQLKITKFVLLKLGAQVESCNNGQEALELVSKGLSDQKKHRVFDSLPYDYIFMDCQMPEMDGAEATRLIREEEARYGVRIPIVGLTAHTDGVELARMKKAGIDFHLNKPLKEDELLLALFPAGS